MRILLFLSFVFLLLFPKDSFSQTNVEKYKYAITTTHSGTAVQQKECIDLFRSLLNTDYCKYDVNTNSFIVIVNELYNTEDLKIKIEQQGANISIDKIRSMPNIDSSSIKK